MILSTVSSEHKGFTLIELLVVIAVIGILSSIGLVSLNGARERARDAVRRTDATSFRTMLALYFDDFGSYPDVTSVLAPRYVPDLPLDPKTHLPYTYSACPSGVNSSYIVYAQLESTTSGQYFYLTSKGVQGTTSNLADLQCS